MASRIFSKSVRYSTLGWGFVLLFTCLVIRFWHPAYGFTGLLQMDASSDASKIAAFKDVPVYIYTDTGGYDGQYYAQIAYHPLLNAKELIPAMDSLSYRARRILPSALAYCLALGNPYWIVNLYCVLNGIAWFILAYLLWKILVVNDTHSLLAWLGVMFSAGALESVRLALTDLIALCIIAAGMFAIERNKKTKSPYLFAAAGLCRETALLSLSVFLDIKKGENWITFQRLKLIIISILPLSLWLIYIRYQTGLLDSGIGNLTWPLFAYLNKWETTLDAFSSHTDFLLTLTTLLALVGISVQALYIFRTFDFSSMWYRLGASYTLLMLFLGQAVWDGFPGAAQRVLLPLTLAFNVIVRRRRTHLLIIIAGNLAVVSGLLTLKDVPHDSHELYSGSVNHIATIVRISDGFYGCENTFRHRWSWCSGHGVLEFETWPKKSGIITVGFKLRSLANRKVTALSQGNLVYAAEINEAKREGVLRIPFKAGLARIDFISDGKAVPETSALAARQLAFALYDLTVVTVTAK